MSEPVWIDVAATAEVEDGGMKAVQVNGAHLALYSVAGELYATSNICTHAFTYLTDGWLEDHLIECPLHAGVFDIRTGKGQGAPIVCDLQTYAVRIVGDRIELAIL